MASPNTSYPFKYYAIFHWTMMMGEPGCIPSMTLPLGFPWYLLRSLRTWPARICRTRPSALIGRFHRQVWKKKNGEPTKISDEQRKNILVGWLFRVYVGMKLLPSYICENYFINHEIRIPSLNNQFFYGSSIRHFFFRGSDGGMGSFAWIYVFSRLPC